MNKGQLTREKQNRVVLSCHVLCWYNVLYAGECVGSLDSQCKGYMDESKKENKGRVKKGT